LYCMATVKFAPSIEIGVADFMRYFKLAQTFVSQ
jgi:hypothetical protein